MNELSSVLTEQYAYVVFAIVLAIGLYMVVANENLVKKVIGLNLFQTAIFLFFVSSAYVAGGRAPSIPSYAAETERFVSPLPQVIVLTAIVVGVSLTAVALALIVRIYDEYGTLHEDVIREVRTDD